ncbi:MULTISPECIES: nucleoid-associated protein [unclassified Leeuwenhoekiella]|uniref:nucleoid-associated protein n=1 Tax=unclassified Leeuwenhoekiella TaxID=2615029 RepID=UPI000C4A22D6|nr:MULTISPECIES: nucleoid-associated protein [unclassified Leeuwenhoekiella]MAW94880.1 nucleoid-associated protein NdpA [Leeuwenhoekiella sp.]MBA79600.1 nucleoid-associated protein NdpA [Leeuwenhoekiella sp.]|tara:strand:- start:232 stop:1290 length:1059 start_codon:yes stop_codon:yes gene_type:complete
MINLYSAQIESLSIHRVGNKSRSEGAFLSKERYQLNDEITPLIKEFFFKPFRDKEENYYQFVHESDLEFHELSNLVKSIFENPSRSHEVSVDIAKLLYEQSEHPHIKPGEVYVAHIENVMLDNEKVDAVGIFKSELKQDFLQFKEGESNLNMHLEQGVSLNKLDKGCLIFNKNADEGYKILSIDSNRYDAKYWLDSFLGVDILADENFHTKKYLKFCQDFAKDVVLPAEDKKEEVMFMNRAVNHFAKNDEFVEQNFMNEVMENPALIPEFNNYKIEKAPKYKIEDLTSFPISNTAVTAARKKIKSVIELDTNIQIKLDFINPESAEKFVEKGWDEERQMYYYLVYFNKEQKS